jgi:23S rRNA (adenine2030-N6)-methyltransferase
MFSYRHGFHAGNHADVLKHTALVATLRHLVLKDTALTFIDTHAGAGLYRLDSEHARTSGEALDGIARLNAITDPLCEALQDYREVVRSFSAPGSLRQYPGSPFIAQRLLRAHDRLRLFELHPTDSRALDTHVRGLRAGRQVTVLREDGFEGLARLLPPPSRRALVLCDPSYEIKSDYARVPALVAEALKRFPTGVYMVWHPIIARPEAHDLPRKLRTLAGRARKSWLQATLTVKSGKNAKGLPASGIFVINPPHTLRERLAPALAQMAELLAQDASANFSLEASPEN